MSTLLEIKSQLKEVSELAKPDTLASYYAADYQFSVGKIVSTPDNYSFHVLVDDLSEEGMKVYSTIQEKIKNEEWEDEVMEDAVIEKVRSGMWTRNIHHPLHEQILQENDEIGSEISRCCICTWRNLICLFTHNESINFSPIIMYTNDWVYTYHCALYKVRFRHEE